MTKISNNPGEARQPTSLFSKLLKDGVAPPKSFKELRDLLATQPSQKPDKDIRKRSAFDRYQLLADVEALYVPTSQDLRMAAKIIALMQAHYDEITPAAYWRTHEHDIKRFAASKPKVTSRTFGVWGTTGRGKSRMLDNLFSMFQPVYRPDAEKEPELPRAIIPVVPITCEVKDSQRAFTTSFFEETDYRVGTTYSDDYESLNYDEKIERMARIVRVHMIGMLVVDEAQRLIGKGSEHVMKFLLRLTNTIKIPIIFVGTPEAQEVLTTHVAEARRMLGPMYAPFAANSEDWKAIIDELWLYQYTAVTTTLNPQLRAKIYELTQGVPAFAKSLFCFAQERLILNSTKPSEERLTVGLLQKVFDEDMYILKPAIDALRSGCDLRKFTGLLPTESPKPQHFGAGQQHHMQSVYDTAALKALRKLAKEDVKNVINRPYDVNPANN